MPFSVSTCSRWFAQRRYRRKNSSMAGRSVSLPWSRLRSASRACNSSLTIPAPIPDRRDADSAASRRRARPNFSDHFDNSRRSDFLPAFDKRMASTRRPAASAASAPVVVIYWSISVFSSSIDPPSRTNSSSPSIQALTSLLARSRRFAPSAAVRCSTPMASALSISLAVSWPCETGSINQFQVIRSPVAVSTTGRMRPSTKPDPNICSSARPSLPASNRLRI